MNKLLNIFLISCLFIFQSALSQAQQQQQLFSNKDSITDGRVWDLAFEDFNKDGSPDFITADFLKPPTIYYNDAKGGFAMIKTIAKEGTFRAHGVGIKDLNNDKKPDIFVVFNNPHNLVYLSDNAGEYLKSDTINSLNSHGLYVALGDIDNDNDIDAFVSNYQQPTILWINNGAGKFTPGNLDFGSNCYNIALGDINNDGNLDIICSQDEANMIIWMNQGNNKYEQNTQSVGYSKGYGKVGLFDMDDDGDLDIILANKSNGGSIWLNDGTGKFSETVKNLTKSPCMTIGDINLDGKPDLIVGNSIWINEGNNKFSPQGELDIKGKIIGLWLHDIDNDGDLDLFYSTINPGGLFLLKNLTKNN